MCVYVLYNTVLIIVFFCVLCFSLYNLCVLYCFTELINSQAQLAHVCVIALITGLSYQNSYYHQICCCQLTPRQRQIQRQRQRHHGPLLPKHTLSADWLLPASATLQIENPLHLLSTTSETLSYCRKNIWMEKGDIREGGGSDALWQKS